MAKHFSQTYFHIQQSNTIVVIPIGGAFFSTQQEIKSRETSEGCTHQRHLDEVGVMYGSGDHRVSYFGKIPIRSANVTSKSDLYTIISFNYLRMLRTQGVLTHRGRNNKLVEVSETAFSNAFFWMK